jgi:hypothetical protein
MPNQTQGFTTAPQSQKIVGMNPTRKQFSLNRAASTAISCQVVPTPTPLDDYQHPVNNKSPAINR